MSSKLNFAKRQGACPAFNFFSVSLFLMFCMVRCADDNVSLTQSELGRLSVAGGLSFEFPLTAVGSSSSQMFTVTNTGRMAVTEMDGLFVVSAFSFAGGSYPGDGATCEDSLEPDESCTVHVAFSPEFATTYESPLRLKYFDGLSNRIATHPVLCGTIIWDPPSE